MTGPLLPGDPERLGSVRLLGRLGAGGMGTVYLGRTPGGLTVAVKTVHEHLAAEPHFRERFRREAAAARAVTGAHTAAVLDADPESARPWLATAYLPGVTLRHAVAATGPLEPPAVRSLGAALAEALTDIHGAGLVHRDLKPSNVLITADGPRVIDFGIARAIGDHGLTGAGDVIGTPGFIAPEQITGAIVTGAPRTRGAVTGAADVFALGAVLVFAATGRSPFGSATGAVLLYRAVHEDPDLTGVPEEVRELAAACLEKDPGRRPTVAEVLDTAADPGAPLWWRAEPLRSLVLGETAAPGAPADPEAPATPAARTPRPPRPHGGDRTRARAPAPYASLPSSLPSLPAHLPEVRGGAPGAHPARPPAGRGRRGRVPGHVRAHARWRRGRRQGQGATADPLAVRRGSVRQGAVRWTLAPADSGATVDALRLTGNSLLVHGVGTLDMSDIGGGRGYVTARGLPDAGRRWVTGAAEITPTQWGVSGSVLAAADLGLDAVDLATGEPHGTQERLGVPLWFSVADGVLISAYDEDTRLPSLQAVDLATGEGRWTEDVPGTRPPAVLGRTVLLADEDGSYIRCTDAVSGRIRWRYEGFEGPVAALAAVPEAGCFALLSTGGALHFVRARDGGRLATATLEGGASAGSSALAAVGSTVLLATGGRVHAYAPATGAPLWSVRTVGLDTSWPAVTGGGRTPVTAGGALLHWARAGQLQCVGLRSGEERWTARLDGVAQVPPVAVAGTVYAATGEVCRALNLNGGAAQHSWDAADIRDLAADRSGWYARLGTATVRAYNHTAVTAPSS
ncbi:protein kinase domain-containing protein [Streptomyces microflavus]